LLVFYIFGAQVAEFILAANKLDSDVLSHFVPTPVVSYADVVRAWPYTFFDVEPYRILGVEVKSNQPLRKTHLFEK